MDISLVRRAHVVTLPEFDSVSGELPFEFEILPVDDDLINNLLLLCECAGC